MEIYDYSTDDLNRDIGEALDAMSPRELRAAALAIQAIRQDCAAARADSSLSWFNAAILPALLDFAELTSSVLEVSDSDRPVISATFKNQGGLDITESCKCMRMALHLANHIRVGADDEGATLTLVFDCRDYVE